MPKLDRNYKAGPGRPPKGLPPMTPRQVYATREQWDEIDRARGATPASEYLREAGLKEARGEGK